MGALVETARNPWRGNFDDPKGYLVVGVDEKFLAIEQFERNYITKQIGCEGLPQSFDHPISPECGPGTIIGVALPEDLSWRIGRLRLIGAAQSVL